MPAISGFLTSINSFIPTLEPSRYVNPILVMPGVPGRVLHNAFSSDTTVSSCTTDPIRQKDTAPLLKPVPMKVTIEPPLDGPALGRMSTISARGDKIIGTPPDAVVIPSPMMLIVMLPARFGGSRHCKLDEDSSMAGVAVCIPSRQDKSEPTKLLPSTVTVTAVSSGAMLGMTSRICNAGRTSNRTAWVDVSMRASSETSICTVPT